MALCPECALNVSTPVTYARDRCAYVVDLTLDSVESTAFGRQGPEVQILSPRPLTDWFINLSTVTNACFIYDSSSYKLRRLPIQLCLMQHSLLFVLKRVDREVARTRVS